MIVKAINNYVGLFPLKVTERTFGGIFIPGSENFNNRWFKVQSAGPGVPDFNSQLIVPDVEVGDIVYVMSHGQFEIKLSAYDQEDQFIASVNDIILKEVDLENKIMQPLGSYVEIEKIERKAEENVKGIFIPSNHRYPENVGRVKSVGSGFKTPDGNSVPFQVSVGDLVAYNPFAETIVDFSNRGLEYKTILVLHGEIHAILEEAN